MGSKAQGLGLRVKGSKWSSDSGLSASSFKACWECSLQGFGPEIRIRV